MANNERIDLIHSYFKYPLPESMLKDLCNELKQVTHYPTGGEYSELCQILADYSGVKKENIFPGNGSDEIIEMITRTYPGKILIPAPTFSQYEESANRVKSSKLLVKCLINGEYAIHYSSKHLEESSLVWICNPNNPTGTLIPRGTIIDILQKSKGMVAVDECNFNFSGETVVDLIEKYPNLIISRSFSKDFGLAGLRLGFMISNTKNIKKVATFGQYFRVNRLAEKSVEKALRYLEYFEKAWKSIEEIRDNVIKELRDLDFNVLDSKSNFVFLEFKNKNKAIKVWNYLKKNNIFTTAAWESEFTVLNDQFLRICIGKKKEMKKVLEVLARYRSLKEA